MNEFINWLSTIDWQTVGSVALVVIINLIGAATWLRKNLTNINKLVTDSKLTNSSIKYSKASIKSNQDLAVEVNKLKREVENLGKLVNKLTTVMKDEVKNNDL